MDPPFKERKINQLLFSILEMKILKNNGLIIIHRNRKEEEDFWKNLIYWILDIMVYQKLFSPNINFSKF